MTKLVIITILGLALTGCGHTPVPPPPPPPPLSPTVSVRWDQQRGVDHFNVYRDGALLGSASNANFLDKHPSRGKVNTYSVTAVNVSGESKMSEPSSAFVP